MTSLYEVGVGLLLGFTLTAPPGPMNVLIASQAVRSLRRGIVTGMGAMSADAILGVVVYVLSRTTDVTAFVRPIYILGCVVMGYFGYRLLAPRPPTAAPPAGTARTYSTSLLIGLSNPFQILWWLTAGLAFAYVGGVLLFTGLFCAIAVWIVAFPYAISTGAQRSPAVERWITYGSGFIMIAFAAYFAFLAVVGG
jgi:threonine/homoserine/homoserine lactone efflux protein